MAKKITIITTGGTIEKTYNEDDGSLTNHGSILKAMLARLRLPAHDIEQVNLIAKDSQDMKDHDRRQILDEIERHLASGKPVIVLHGTDTMAQTARYVYEELKTPEASVIFTGAMKPYGFEDSDAMQNLTESLFAAGSVSPGVYIVFHGQALPLPDVEKDYERHTFRTV